jgi:hypothetical protein
MGTRKMKILGVMPVGMTETGNSVIMLHLKENGKETFEEYTVCCGFKIQPGHDHIIKEIDGLQGSKTIVHSIEPA